MERGNHRGVILCQPCNSLQYSRQIIDDCIIRYAENSESELFNDIVTDTVIFHTIIMRGPIQFHDQAMLGTAEIGDQHLEGIIFSYVERELTPESQSFQAPVPHYLPEDGFDRCKTPPEKSGFFLRGLHGRYLTPSAAPSPHLLSLRDLHRHGEGEITAAAGGNIIIYPTFVTSFFATSPPDLLTLSAPYPSIPFPRRGQGKQTAPGFPAPSGGRWPKAGRGPIRPPPCCSFP